MRFRRPSGVSTNTFQGAGSRSFRDLVRNRTVAKVGSIGLVVLRWIQSWLAADGGVTGPGCGEVADGCANVGCRGLEVLCLVGAKYLG